MTEPFEPTTRYPAGAGVGLRSRHIAEVMDGRPLAAWFEVHAENYMGSGPAVCALEGIPRDYPTASGSRSAAPTAWIAATSLDRRR